MPALTVVLAFIKGGLGWLWEFFSSHFGQLVLVGLVAWFWAGHRARVACDERFEIARAEAVAAANAETARQAEAARDIAAAATARVEEEQALEKELRAQIDAFDKEEVNEPTKPTCSPAVIRPCRVDDRFADSVRRLDAAARRAPKPARGAR